MNMNNVGQFAVYLMNGLDMKKHIVNCASENQAINICLGLFNKFRVIDVIRIH